LEQRRRFYEDRLDPDGVGLMDKSLNERYQMFLQNLCRTWKNQMASIFADQLSNNGGSGFGWFGGQGAS